MLRKPRRIVNPFISENPDEMEAYMNMIHDPEWESCKTFRDQCRILHKYLRNNEIHISDADLGHLFGSPNCVKKQFIKIRKVDRGEMKPNGRPSLLSPQIHTELENQIHLWHANRHFPSYEEILDYIEEHYNIKLTNVSIRNYIKYHYPFATATGVPFESERVECKEADIDDYFEKLKQRLDGVDGRFCFNLDEVGQQDFVDALDITVIVPKELEGTRILIPVRRNSRRASALSCIAPDGINPPPLIIIPRKTIDSEIFNYVPKNAFTVAYQENGFMTITIFRQWWMHSFIPFLRQKKRSLNYSGKTVVIMDQLRAHVAVVDSLSDDIASDNIEVQYLVPHSSDQTQPLDLGVFGRQKKIAQGKVLADIVAHDQTKQIIKVISSIYEATTPIRCLSAFKQSGLNFVSNVPKDEIPYIEVRRGMARAVRHYQKEVISMVPIPTAAQLEANATRLTSETIHNNSLRISIVDNLK